MAVATVEATHGPTEEQAFGALGVVLDPELDEPITDLGFVRSLEVDHGEVTVHLRLPTSFCSPNFAYLMASDAKDVLTTLDGVHHVHVELDDHHDSEIINRGLAADAGYKGTFLHEAEQDLDELRATFRRKAHTAAMERCLTALLRERDDLPEAELGTVRLADLPATPHTDALLRRREAVGLPTDDDAVVMVDHEGRTFTPDEVPMALRRARSTRISIDGNAHFCRGLLATRYPGADGDQTARTDGAEPSDPTFIPLATLKERRP
ncbi:metal-sulfur cluster assembly factor [Solicola sp. PLA-1-18]|uniref:metal-sulfur cluster assembly factor n=1 Tax=Solicola sp. PLA-1-18 TaxID=3380532 RepID=UPI003B7EA5DB